MPKLDFIFRAKYSKIIREQICQRYFNYTLISDIPVLRSVGNRFFQKVKIDSISLSIKYYNNSDSKSLIPPEDINFEILLHVLELLYEYYLIKDSTNPVFFRPEWLGLFEIIKSLDKEIPEGTSINYINFSKNYRKGIKVGEYIFQCYYEIYILIKTYSIKFTEASQLNKDLAEMINELSKEYILRCYTLNYDDFLNKVSTLVPFYNGFDKIHNLSNYKKINSDRNIDCFYNMHGSFNYKWEKIRNLKSGTGTNGYRLVYDCNLKKTERSYFRNVAEKGILYRSSIITGQKKLLHTLHAPFNAFLHSFRQDCVENDMFLSIGYSYSDNHINDCISSAMEANEDSRFWNLSYASDIKDESPGYSSLSYRWYIKLLEESGKICKLKKITDNVFMHNGKRIYNIQFKDFLHYRKWKDIFE